MNRLNLWRILTRYFAPNHKFLTFLKLCLRCKLSFHDGVNTIVFSNKLYPRWLNISKCCQHVLRNAMVNSKVGIYFYANMLVAMPQMPKRTKLKKLVSLFKVDFLTFRLWNWVFECPFLNKGSIVFPSEYLAASSKMDKSAKENDFKDPFLKV